MRFAEAPLPGVWVIELEPQHDERGWFTRTFDAAAFSDLGITLSIVQSNASYNARAGTLRGMHYQARPHGESKLIRCVAGAVYDVALDLRPESGTCGGWYAVELSESNQRMLFVPPGVAHGFQTLRDHSELLYQVDHPYVEEAGRGVRWDDPAFRIEWPPAPAGGRALSQRDLSFPDWPGEAGGES